MKKRCWVVCCNDAAMCVVLSSAKAAGRIVEEVSEEYWNQHRESFRDRAEFKMRMHWHIREAPIRRLP